eukprot:10626819-Karenia_brevis.AAC.1
MCSISPEDDYNQSNFVHVEDDQSIFDADKTSDGPCNIHGRVHTATTDDVNNCDVVFSDPDDEQNTFDPQNDDKCEPGMRSDGS